MVTWSSSDTSVATVDAKTGVVTAISPGTATITATTAGGVSASCVVTVVPKVNPPETPTAALANATSGLSGGDAAWANGSDPQKITVSLHDADGNLVPIDCTTLTASAPAWVSAGKFTANSDGTCSALVTSTAPGVFPVRVFQNGTQIGLPLDTHFIGIIPPVKQGSDGSWTVSGAGFWPGESADVWVHSSPIKVASGLKADKDGNVTATFTLPVGFPSGAHDVYFVGKQSGTTDTASFTVPVTHIVQTGGALAPTGGVPAAWAMLLVMLGGAALLWRRMVAVH